MKPSEIRALSDKELVEKLDDLKSELFNLRFQHRSEERRVGKEC